MQSMPDFSEILKLAQTPQGRRLIAMLQSSDPAALGSALTNAKAGDFEAAKSALSGILEDPEAQALLRSMGGGHG